MTTFAQYSNEVLTVVMTNLKNGVSGSTIADTLVSSYGFEREAALTIITGTLLLLEKANTTKEYRVMYFFGTWVTKETFAAESDKEAIFDADMIINDSNLKDWQHGVALFCGSRKVKTYK